MAGSHERIRLMEVYGRFVRAAETKDARVLENIIRECPELNVLRGNEPLDVLERHCPELLEVAFQAGLSPDLGGAEVDATLLQKAADVNNVDLVRLCLRYGADVELRNRNGETALGFAAAWNAFDAVCVLVEEGGADVNALEGRQGDYPSTALDAAGHVLPGYERIRAYLLERGARKARELLGYADELSENSDLS